MINSIKNWNAKIYFFAFLLDIRFVVSFLGGTEGVLGVMKRNYLFMKRTNLTYFLK